MKKNVRSQNKLRSIDDYVCYLQKWFHENQKTCIFTYIYIYDDRVLGGVWTPTAVLVVMMMMMTVDPPPEYGRATGQSRTQSHSASSPP